MNKKDLIAVLAVELLILLVFVPVLITGRVFLDSPALLDITYTIMPNLHWMAENWRAGEFPLWYPHVVFGMPHLGYAHSAGLNPVFIIIYLLLHGAYAYSAAILVHLMLASLLFYAAMRREVGLGYWFSAAGAVVFCLSGAMFGWMNVTVMLSSMCALLAAWLCFGPLCRRPRAMAFAGGALATAWSGFCGYVELMVYGLMVLFIIQVAASGIPLQERVKRGLLVVSCAAAGFLIMSPLILHSQVLVQYSVRGPHMGVEFTFPNIGGHWPLLVPTLLLPFEYYKEMMPHMAFNHGLSPYYSGFLMPWLSVLGAVSALRVASRRPIALAWVFVVGYFAFRKLPLLSEFFDLLPVLGDLHAPFKAMVMIQTLGIALAMGALSDGLGNEAGKRRKTTSGAILFAGLMAAVFQPWCMGGVERYFIAGLALVAGASMMVWKGRSISYWATCIVLAVIVLDAFSLAFRYVPRTAPHRFELHPGLERFARTLSPETRFAVFERLLSEDVTDDAPVYGLFEMTSGAQNITGPSRVPPARSTLYLANIYKNLILDCRSEQTLLFLWSMTNPGTLERKAMHLINLAGTRVVLARGFAVPWSSPYSLLKRYSVEWKGRGGLARLDREKERLKLWAPFKIEFMVSAEEGDRLIMRAQADEGTWLAAYSRVPGKDETLIWTRFVSPAKVHSPSLRLEDSPRELSIHGAPLSGDTVEVRLENLSIENTERPLQRKAKFGKVDVYWNTQALPRAFICRGPVLFDNMGEVVEWISDPGLFEPRRQVALERAGKLETLLERMSSKPVSPYERVRIDRYGPHKVEMTARLLGPGILVFTDSYFPGWKSYVDGTETRHFPADLAFRGLYLSEGVHGVKWVYEPSSFSIGLWTGIGSLFSLFMLLGFRLRMERRESSWP